NLTTYGILVTINGTAGLFAMLLTPVFSRKVGNRNLVLIQNTVNIFAITGMLLTYRMDTFILYFIFIYINQFINSFSVVLDPVIHSEVKDYQQYISGKRLDFTFGAAGIVGMPIGIITGALQPFIFEYYGYTTNANIFYDPTMRDSLFFMLFILSIIGAILNLIPLSFYDLTDSKHKNLIHVLRLRALFADYSAGEATSRQIKETVDNLNKAKALCLLPVPDVRAAVKDYIKIRKKGRNPEAQAAYKKIFADRRLKIDIEGARFLMSEFDKYSNNPFVVFKTALSERIAALSFDGFAKEGIAILAEAKSMPTATPEQRRFARYAKARGNKLIKVAERIKTARIADAGEYDTARLDAALALPDKTKSERKIKAQAVRAEEKIFSKYHKTFGVWTEAKEIVKERADRMKYGEIEARYDEAAAEVAELDLADKAEDEAQALARAAEKERTRAELAARRSPKKNARVLKRRQRAAQKMRPSDETAEAKSGEKNHDEEQKPL
ncbi:MAG: MFS transporter, partial [Clostridiales bacterium]|nr:MFS transporter [Clostridiales bacterium]